MGRGARRRRDAHGRGRDSEEGSASVMTAALIPAVLVLLALVIEVGAAVDTYRELADRADAAARAGATALDENLYRESDGRLARLDPSKARSAALAHLQVNEGAPSASVTATPAAVTVTLTATRRPVIFAFVGSQQLTAEATAVPLTGINAPEDVAP